MKKTDILLEKLLPTLTKTLSPTTFSRCSCRVISLSAILSSVCRRPAGSRRRTVRSKRSKNGQRHRREAGGGVTVEVNLQQVGLRLLLLLLQVPQHTLQQLRSTNTTPSLIAEAAAAPDKNTHRGFARSSGAHDQHRVALPVDRRPLQQLQQVSATHAGRDSATHDALLLFSVLYGNFCFFGSNITEKIYA